MSKTHWKRLHNPEYIGAYSLDEGKDLIVTIKSTGLEKVKGENGKEEDCTVIHFVESNIKPFICNATNAKTIAKLYGSPYIEDWAGNRIQLYATTTKLKGETVEALRIRPFKPEVKQAEKKIFCSECKKQVEGYGSKNATQIAQLTQKNYGEVLCTNCATKRSEKNAKEQATQDVQEKPDTEGKTE